MNTLRTADSTDRARYALKKHVGNEVLKPGNKIESTPRGVRNNQVKLLGTSLLMRERSNWWGKSKASSSGGLSSWFHFNLFHGMELTSYLQQSKSCGMLRRY